jgi:cytochrome d ubiquinol oxidase subunit II
VPHQVTYQQAAAAPESQSLLLVGTAIMLPVVLANAAYGYYVFRGKASHETAY